MGGKKGPEKNRKYEKNRRDRFNNQFLELNKLLPDFGSSVIKATKAEIIGRTIQFLQDVKIKNKKLEDESEKEKNQINDLQKRVTGLLQIIKELIALLHTSDADFPTSLPLDDFVSFKEAFMKFKRTTADDSENENAKKTKMDCTNYDSEVSDPTGTSNCDKNSVIPMSTNATSSNTVVCTSSVNNTSINQPSKLAVESSKTHNTSVTNFQTPSVLRLDSSPLILPNANILAVDGLQNAVINSINNSPTVLVNKQITVPTLILMQNSNFIPVCSVQQVSIMQQRSQKLIVPKQSVMSTKTTFINKKPIPAVCLYKSNSEGDKSSGENLNSFHKKLKKSKKSKGILVKFPKRKPPKKKKNSSENQKQNVMPLESSTVIDTNTLPSDKDFAANSNESNSFNMENCYSMNETTFNENSEINKNYSCSENMFGATETQNSNEFNTKNVQFIDFFESTSTRSIENGNENVHSVDSSQYLNASENTCDKIEKSARNQNVIDLNFKRKENFSDDLNICNSNYPDANMNCGGLESDRVKETESMKDNDEKRDSVCMNEPVNQMKNINSIYHHLPTSCGISNESLLMKFAPDNSPSTYNHTCTKDYPEPVAVENNFENSLIKNVGKTSSVAENMLSKRKPTDKEIVPLSIHCNEPENKSISKELSLSLMDEKKHYDNVTSFDEFSNDLFTSLQVPASGQNTDSISPTAAFLLTFPLVSSCKNADLLPENEHEDDNGNTTATTSTTILQIGNLESPPTLLFTSSKFSSRETHKTVHEKSNFPCSKADESYSSGFCTNAVSNMIVNDLSNTEHTMNSSKEKIKDGGKENEINKQYTPACRPEGYNFNEVAFVPKNTCVNKDILPVSQSMPFYTPSCTTSSFPSYSIFTKYNDIPSVTASYYSLGSQAFPVTKSVTNESLTEYNSWVTIPSIYNQDIDLLKDKPKRDKCTSTHSFKSKQNDFSCNISTFGLSVNDLNASQPERPKVDKTKKTQKQNNTRLVNWMTSPDLKNSSDTSQSHALTDNFLLQKDDPMSTNSFLNSPSIPNVQNSVAFGNASYSSAEYFLDNQNYSDNQNLNSCKVTYASSNPTSYSWSPSKSNLPALSHLDTHNMMIPSTLPTLVGDLALGNSNPNGPVDKIFNNFDLLPKKCSSETDKSVKRDACNKNFCKNDRIAISSEYTKSNPQSSFLSVTQLVDDKDRIPDNKYSAKNTVKTNTKLNATSIDQNCHFESDLNREKCNFLRNKENYGNVLETTENSEYSKKSYINNVTINTSCMANTSKADTNNENIIKSNQSVSMKYKNKELKYNVNRCLAKENKKESRSVINSSHQKPYDYGVQSNTSCDSMTNKGVNPLSNKNSNYSAESLISTSNHQNSCSSQNYFSYDGTNYANCSGNEYARKRIEPEADSSLTNVGYYTNTNYVYPNNFQSFNNYGFSNQCYNNYSSQIQHAGLQKKSQKDLYNKQDTDWYKESFPSHYNSLVPGDFSNQNKSTDKCKQPFSTNKFTVQKNSASNSNVQNSKYYQYNSTALSNNSKNSCSFNASYSFSQSIQQCSESSCAAPNYDMKSSRNNAIVNNNNNNNNNNSNAQHTATSLTNFNLSAIFPEINDKHCNQNAVSTIGNEKKDSNFSNNKINVDEMNYSYLPQPSSENNMEPVSVYGSSSFQIQHFPEFGNRKSQK